MAKNFIGIIEKFQQDEDLDLCLEKFANPMLINDIKEDKLTLSFFITYAAGADFLGTISTVLNRKVTLS